MGMAGGDASVPWASLVGLQVGQSLSKEQVSSWTPCEVGKRWELWLRGVPSVNLWKPCMEGDLAVPPKRLTQTGRCILLLVLSYMPGNVGNGY